jgi:L-ascorbate metabolism protein UlaG (beta-lactamase superfamily)
MDVTVEWLGVATYRVRAGSAVLFLDAYMDRPSSAPQVGLSTAQVERADFVFVGHSHFDHLYGAERIARNTGARIVGSYETVRVMEQAGVPVDQMVCVAGGETVALSDDVRVSAFPSQHSCVWSHTRMGQADEVCLGDLGLTWQEQRARFQKLIEHMGTGLPRPSLDHLVAAQQGDRGDGGALVYVFDTPDGRLFYQDTSGYWSGIVGSLGPRPDVAIVAAAGRGNIDGSPIQGSLAQFVGRQVSLLGPRRVVLAHHDDWLPGFSVDTDIGPIRDELARVAPDTSLVELGYLDGTVILP